GRDAGLALPRGGQPAEALGSRRAVAREIAHPSRPPACLFGGARRGIAFGEGGVRPEGVVVGSALLLDAADGVERFRCLAASRQPPREVAVQPERSRIVVLVPPPPRHLGERAGAVRSGLAGGESQTQAFRSLSCPELVGGACLDPERMVPGVARRSGAEDRERLPLGSMRVAFRQPKLRFREALAGARLL